MRVLCLFFPRLGIELALRSRPGFRSAAVALLQGAGDDAVVSAASCELAARGVMAGMTAGEARRRVPETRFLPDNANACLESLERAAAILRARATPFVEVGGREHLFLDITRLAHGPSEEARLAGRLAAFAGSWLQSLARAGVADTRADALEAARAARRGPQVVGTRLEHEAPLNSYPAGMVRVAAICSDGSNELAVSALARRLARKLDLVLEARAATTRLLIVRAGAWRRSVWLPAPEERPSRQLAALLRELPAVPGPLRIELEAAALGPLVRVAVPAAFTRPRVLARAG